MTLHLRPYQSSDYEFILSLVARFSEFELPEWRRAEEIDQTNQRLLEQALNQPEPESAIFIAEDEGGVLAGFIHLQTLTDYFNGERHGYISDLAVDKACEGRGVGRLLLDSAEEWARQKGYRLLTLHVFSGNTHAQQIYEKRGFKPEVLKYVRVLK
jgi:ribosomal protein S18 acetylase RimI-like enzyme